MEIDIFKHIIEISSGFIGVGVYKLFNGDTELQDFNKNLFQYFIFAAAAWVLFAKDALIGMINKIYEKTGRNKTFLKESLFEMVFDKNSPQAIEVTKKRRATCKRQFGILPRRRQSFFFKRFIKIQRI